MTSWAGIRQRIQQLELDRGNYSGIPMLVEDAKIAMAPRHPRAKALNGATLGPSEPDKLQEFTCSAEQVDEGERVANEWWSKRLRTEVFIVWHGGRPGDPGFRAELAYQRWAPHTEALFRWKWAMDTLHVAQQAWDPAAELKAVSTLSGLISKKQMETYTLTGMFVESSKRSTCKYLFRKGRPTIVLQRGISGDYRPKIALCLHPLAYYERTFAGGMVPTDDVIAHLLLMRADEARFWRAANQHPIDRPEAGV